MTIYAMRICMAVEKFSPNRRWQIDTLIKATGSAFPAYLAYPANMM